MFRNVFAALMSFMVKNNRLGTINSALKNVAPHTWPGLMRRNPMKVPGNYCNNARRNKPHQGAQECARRRGDLKRDRYADAA